MPQVSFSKSKTQAFIISTRDKNHMNYYIFSQENQKHIIYN